MIDYIGDLSRRDAELLRDLAQHARRILEFGVGASTQIFAVYGRGTVDSVETEPAWIAKTVRNIAALRMPVAPVEFHAYETFKPAGEYDLIFVDGRQDLRLPFAHLTWPALARGGVMAFHDTRRGKDVRNVCAVIEHWSSAVETVTLNARCSHTTTIQKRAALPFEDYNALEGRTLAQLGLE